MVNVCFEAYCRDKTPNLTQYGEVANRIESIKLLEWVSLLFEDHNFLRIIHIQVSLVRHKVLTLIGPNSLQPLHYELMRIVEDDGSTKLDHIVLFDEGDKRDDHIDKWDFVIEVKEDVNVPLDVLYYA